VITTSPPTSCDSTIRMKFWNAGRSFDAVSGVYFSNFPSPSAQHSADIGRGEDVADDLLFLRSCSRRCSNLRRRAHDVTLA